MVVVGSVDGSNEKELPMDKFCTVALVALIPIIGIFTALTVSGVPAPL